MRLGTKIIIGFICISLLLAFIGIISDQFTSDIRQEQLRYVNEASEVVIYTGEMERSLFQSLIFLNGIREAIAVEEDYENIQEFPAAVELTEQFEQELNQFEQSVDSLQKLLIEDETLPPNLNELLKSYQAYKSISREWLSLSGDDADQANRMFINSIEPYFRNNIIPEITELRSLVLSFQEEQNQTLDESLQRAAIINYVATSLSVLLAIGLAIFIYRSIANPLSKVSTSAKRIGEGYLDERIDVSSKDEIGELAEAFNSMAEGLQRSTVSKAYLDNIIESIQEALFVADKEGKLVRVNSAAAKLTGYQPKEMLGEPVNEFYNLRDMRDSYEEHLRSNNSFEFSLFHKDGSVVPVLFSEAKLVDNQGQFVGTVSVASDISDRKEAEQEIRNSLREKEVMLAEIHHRVKNNLAVISGLLQLQSYSTGNPEVEKALTDSQMRIQSIALVHEMLYESESLAYIKYDKYINDLLQAIRSMHMNDGQDILVTSDIEPISLSVNQAIPCSLLVNELIVNAYKHAFKKGEKGTINVKLRKKGTQIIMIISDDGRGLKVEALKKSDSLGMSLIKTLTKQLQGTFEMVEDESHKGSIFKVQFEIEN